MLASIHSVPIGVVVLVVGFGALIAMWLIGKLFRGAVTMGALVIMLLVGASLLFALLAPAPRKSQTKVTPPPSPTAPIRLPLASAEAGRHDIESYIETAIDHGHRAAEIAHEKIQIGAEAVTGAAHRIAGETKALVREHHIQIPPIPDAAIRVVRGVRHSTHARLAGSGIMAFAIGALLYLGYIFLDASTRGHFTWSLRFVSVVTFAALCAALSFLRHAQ